MSGDELTLLKQSKNQTGEVRVKPWLGTRLWPNSRSRHGRLDHSGPLC